MKSISSAEFRKTYQKLTEPTFVTVNGRIVGTWVPLNYDQQEAERRLTKVNVEVNMIPADIRKIVVRGRAAGFNPDPEAVQQMQRHNVQRNRDAILRKINKGG